MSVLSKGSNTSPSILSPFDTARRSAFHPRATLSKLKNNKFGKLSSFSSPSNSPLSWPRRKMNCSRGLFKYFCGNKALERK